MVNKIVRVCAVVSTISVLLFCLLVSPVIVKANSSTVAVSICNTEPTSLEITNPLGDLTTNNPTVPIDGQVNCLS